MNTTRTDAAEIQYARLIQKAAAQPLRWPESESLQMFAHLLARTPQQISEDIERARTNATPYTHRINGRPGLPAQSTFKRSGIPRHPEPKQTRQTAS